MKRLTLTIAAAFALAASAATEGEIRPGKIWRDTSGYAINAHGGGVMFHDGRYWWYGEHKVYGEAGNFAHVGVHCYSSKDLTSWNDEGIALKVSDNPVHLIGDGCIIERPKVLFCAKTGKFVMYFHLENHERSLKLASAGIAVADKPEGPFSFVRAVRPNGDDCRDMTLFLDDDGSAWHFFSSERNKTMHAVRLSEDFIGYDGPAHRMFIDDYTEAPAVFKTGGYYWCIGSGCTGWRPNEARYYRAERITGPWTRVGNPCKGVNPQNGLGPEKTWGGQSTCVFRIEGRDAFVAMFDIWRPENQLDSRYVWLPVTVKGDFVEIPWRDSWRVSSDAGFAGNRDWDSCSSREELEFVRGSVVQIDTTPGTPEPDAKRFHSSTSPNEHVEFNYDESKAGEPGKDFTLEDPLELFGGRRVTKANWPERRRELLDFFEREVYGRLPPRPPEMSFDLMDEKMSGDGFATIRHYRQCFRKDKSGPVIDWIAIVPRHAKGTVPVFLHLNYAGLKEIERKKTNHYDLPWDMIVANGYAFMSAHYTQITGDGEKRGGFFNGVCELWGGRDFENGDNPGSLMIWAWGLMRGLDLAERIPEIDATRSVVIGSSRLGKAALLAAAYDERFAVCIPNQTGALGVQLMKRDYGETLKGQRLSFPHWYCRNVWKYADDPKKQPFDQHLLLSCIAPRALLLECYHKRWFDPKGEWMAAKAASPVWELLTGRALGGGDRTPTEWPDPYSDAMVTPPFGYVRRTECHGLSPYDWKWAMDFADNALRRQPVASP